VSVDEDHGYHLHQGHHHEANGAGKGVEHLEPVLAGTCAEDETDNEAEETHHASDMLFLNPLDNVNVEEGAQHALQDADLRPQSQRQQHGEEEHGPEGSPGQLHDGLGEHDEGQASALGSLYIRTDMVRPSRL